jgi:integrase
VRVVENTRLTGRCRCGHKRLHEKAASCTPSRHALAGVLRAYIDAAGIAEDRKGWLFRNAPGHRADALTERAMNQYAAWLMIRRRAAAAGITAPIGNHTSRATGITAYLSNGGALEPKEEIETKSEKPGVLDKLLTARVFAAIAGALVAVLSYTHALEKDAEARDKEAENRKLEFQSEVRGR